MGDIVISKNIVMASVAAIALIVIGVMFLGAPGIANGASAGGSQNNGQPIFSSNDTVQEITIGLKSGYYNPREIKVKVGDKIRLFADADTLTGCMHTVIVQNYGKIVAGGAPLEFIADKPGTYRISCPMGMGGGRLSIADANGNVPGGDAPLPPSIHTCGGSGGGGCGGGCGG